jgi:hypothetical protein
MGCDEQNGVPVSMGKMQRQPVRQGLLTPQLPPHVAKPFASLRNCRAETVPAHRTPMTSAASNMDWIFFIIAFLLVPGSNAPGPNVPGPNGDRLFCRLDCNEPAYACGGFGVVKDAGAAQNIGARLCLAAEMVLASCILDIQRQLACGNRSRTENRCHNRRQLCVLDYSSAHDSLSFSVMAPHAGLYLLLFPHWRNPGWAHRTKCGEWRGKGTEAAGSARMSGTAGSATGNAFGLTLQLACGERSRAQNSHNYRCKKSGFHDFRAHDPSFK